MSTAPIYLPAALRVVRQLLVLVSIRIRGFQTGDGTRRLLRSEVYFPHSLLPIFLGLLEQLHSQASQIKHGRSQNQAPATAPASMTRVSSAGTTGLWFRYSTSGNIAIVIAPALTGTWSYKAL
jgi:hypothetical protein